MKIANLFYRLFKHPSQLALIVISLLILSNTERNNTIRIIIHIGDVAKAQHDNNEKK
jgi:hypothetical protein